MKKNLPVTQREVAFPRGVYIVSKTDLKGIITFANDAFVELSGFTRDELIGKNHNLVRHPDMPPGAFQDLWDTVKQGRPWTGIVKNRCKNGDFYWVEALVVPVRKNNQTIGYMSVRTEPSREQVQQAEALYKKINANQLSLPKPSWLRKVSLKTKMTVMASFMVLSNILGGALNQFGGGFGMSPEAINHALQLLGVSSIGVGILLVLLQNKMLMIINRIIGRLDHIAQGDLTDSIPLHRLDELGRINDALVTMQAHLKTMMSEISSAAQVVANNTDDLGQRMEETFAISEMQSDAATQIASAVEELNAAIKGVADGAEQTAHVVSQSRDMLDGASHQMSESRNASRSVVTAVTQAEQTMSELFRSIHAIGVVTSTIKEVAEQTNLLALNAAIEAARAGEAGRGFAVVADEVRKLAERASTQTQQITNTVSEIQRVTQLAVSGMDAARANVDMADQSMDGVQMSLSEVDQHGITMARMSGDIALSTREQAIAGEQIELKVEQIVVGIDQTVGSMGIVRQQARDMRGAAGQLRDLVSYFRYLK